MKMPLVAIVLTAVLALSAPAYSGATDGVKKTGVEAGLEAIENENYEAARVAFTAAIGHGDPMGHYYLGAMHQGGLGGKRSEVKALENYRKAAEKGVREAEFAMGLFYQHGKAFLQKNPDTAVSWYTKAAKRGSASAMYNLGMMYATGEAVPVAQGSNPNYVKARGWFKITRDAMDTEADKTRIDKIITELEGHMTAGQKELSDNFVADWKSKK